MIEALSTPTRRAVDAAGLGRIREKLDAGERLSFEDGVRLFKTPELAAVGALANQIGRAHV